MYKYEKKEVLGGKYGIKYDEYYTTEKWKTTIQQLKTVYDSLPASEKKDCLFWGKHYSQAGAINLFAKDNYLPQAFSYHGSFYNWAPSGTMPSKEIGRAHV